MSVIPADHSSFSHPARFSVAFSKAAGEQEGGRGRIHIVEKEPLEGAFIIDQKIRVTIGKKGEVVKASAGMASDAKVRMALAVLMYTGFGLLVAGFCSGLAPMLFVGLGLLVLGLALAVLESRCDPQNITPEQVEQFQQEMLSTILKARDAALKNGLEHVMKHDLKPVLTKDELFDLYHRALEKATLPTKPRPETPGASTEALEMLKTARSEYPLRKRVMEYVGVSDLSPKKLEDVDLDSIGRNIQSKAVKRGNSFHIDEVTRAFLDRAYKQTQREVEDVRSKFEEMRSTNTAPSAPPPEEGEGESTAM